MILFLLWAVEFRGKSDKFANSKIMSYYRLWGVIALTLFTTEIFILLPLGILSLLLRPFTKINLVKTMYFHYGQELFVIILVFYVILVYDILLRIWARFNFKYSLEWFIIKINQMITKQKSTRLNYILLFKKMKWVDLSKSNNSKKTEA